MDAIVLKVKELAGDAWSDDWAEALGTTASEAVASATASATDAEKAKRVKAAKKADDATAKVAGLEEQLAAAGDADGALKKAQEDLGTARVELAEMKAQIRARDIARAAMKALTDVPEARRGVALKQLDLSGVDLDEAGAVVGLEAKVTALKEAHPFLWESPEDKGAGHGGKRDGTDPPPKGGKGGKDDNSPAALGKRLAERAFAGRGGRRPEVTAHGA